MNGKLHIFIPICYKAAKTLKMRESNKNNRMSDVNSPVFLHFWFCYIKSQFFFSIFCFNKYGPSLNYPNLEKKINSPGCRFTQRAVIISYKNIYFLLKWI